jgi:hypothetical protein
MRVPACDRENSATENRNPKWKNTKHAIDLQSHIQSRLRTERFIRNCKLLSPVVPPETIDATECRYPALGAHACPGEDENAPRG